MPDGSIDGKTPSTVMICDRAAPMCPSCGRTLRLTVGEGWVVVTCDARTRKVTCASKVLIIGVKGGVCVIVQLSVEDFARLRDLDAGADLVLARLGLLSVPLTAAC